MRLFDRLKKLPPRKKQALGNSFRDLKNRKTSKNPIDAEINAIARSTKVAFNVFARPHNYFRNKYSWYYKWHARSYASLVHYFSLCGYILAIIATIWILCGKSHILSSHASASNVVYTNFSSFTLSHTVLTGGNYVKLKNTPINYTYSTGFGSSGSGDGEFTSPYSVATDQNGKIYVSDTGNNRIEVFNSNGTYSRQFGGPGSGFGLFSSPGGLAVDLAGNVYVADELNNVVQKFDASGVFVSQFGGFGSATNQFNRPMGVALDSAGNIYVADGLNQKIKKFDSAGAFDSYVWLSGTYYPSNIAIDANDNLYVIDSFSNYVERFDLMGNFINGFGQLNNGTGDPDNFNGPGGVAFDSADHVFVADRMNCRIQEYQNDGTFIATVTVNSSCTGTEVDSVAVNQNDQLFGLISGSGAGSGFEQYNSSLGTAYITSGSADIISAGAAGEEATEKNWQSISWTTTTLPANTSVKVRLRAADLTSDLSSKIWSNFVTVSGGLFTSGTLTGKKAEIEVVLETSDGIDTAILDRLTANYDTVADGTVVWTHEGVDNNWSTPANWSTDSAPDLNSHIIFNSRNTDDSTIDTGFGGSFASLQVDPGYSGTITAARSITASGDINLISGTLTHEANSTSKQYWLDINAANLTVGLGAQIDATGKGFASDQGPGTTAIFDPYNGWINHPITSGAGYGGIGGEGSRFSGGTMPGGAAYGSIVDPEDLGSGAYLSLSTGGGLIKINLSGTLDNSGNIVANGGTYVNYGFYRGGGGSGGTINITAGTYSGTGYMSVAGSSGAGGGGAGGRIALYYTSGTPDVSHISAQGSFGGSNSISGESMTGSAGTIFVKKSTDSYGSLYITNGAVYDSGFSTHYSEVTTPIIDDITLQDITVSSNARMDFGASKTLSLNGNFLNDGTATVYGQTSGTLTLIGSGTSNITGSNEFYDLTCSVAGKQIGFEYGQTQTVTNNISIAGTSGSHIALVRYNGSGSSQWSINPTFSHVSGIAGIQYVDVADSNNLSTDAILPANSNDNGNNINWFGAQAPAVSSVAASSLSASGADLNGNITSIGSSNATRRGFKYSSVGQQDDSDTYDTGGSYGTGTYSKTLSGLLPNATYYYRAYATNGAGTSYGSWLTLATYANIPSAPSLTVNSVSSIQVVISQNSNPAGTLYAIHNETANQWLKADGTLGAVEVWQNYATWGGGTGIANTSLSTNTQYSYTVKAKNSDGVETSLSSATNKYTMIEVPSGITFGTLDSHSIALSASGSFSNLTSGQSGLDFTETTGHGGGGGVGDSFGTWVQSNSGLVDTGLDVNIQYSYSLKARNGDGVETTSTTASKYTLSNIPGFVSLVADYSSVNGYEITATISANQNPAGTEYYIQFANNSSFTSPTQINWSTSSSYTAVSLSPNTQYWFEIRARNSDTTATSYSASAATVTPPAAPTGPVVSNICSTAALLSWVAAPGADSYTVSIGTDLAGTNLGETSGVATTGKTFSGLTDLVKYHWFVKAVSGSNGTGEPSSIANFTTGTCIAPLAPTDFSGRAVSSSSIAWSWSDSSSEIGYRLLDTSDNILKNNLPEDSISFTENNLNADAVYTRKVQVWNPDGSNNSNLATVNTLANQPLAPTLQTVSSSEIKIIINQSGNSSTTRYAIYNETLGKYVKHGDGTTQDAEDWQLYQDWGGTSGFVNNSLAPNHTYSYKIKAENGNNIATEFSSIASLTTLNRYTLTVLSDGSGDGLLDQSTQILDAGSSLSITATPALHSNFVSWVGCSSVDNMTCRISRITQDTTATATFNLVTFLVAIAKKGDGDGTFDQPISKSVDYNSNLDIQATPDSISSLTLWEGCDKVDDAKCILTNITTDRSLGATFSLKPIATKTDDTIVTNIVNAIASAADNVLTISSGLIEKLDRQIGVTKEYVPVFNSTSSLSLAAISIGMAPIANAVTLFSLPEYLRSLIYALGNFLTRRKRRQWGKLVEVGTGVVIPQAKIILTRISEVYPGGPVSEKVIATTFSDHEGNFSFVAAPGKYKVSILKDCYVMAKIEGYYQPGSIIEVKSEKESFVIPNIALTLQTEKARKKLLFLKRLEFIEKALIAVSFVCLVLATITSIHAFVKKPDGLTEILTMVSVVVLWIINIRSLLKISPWGNVVDKANRKGVSLALVRIMDNTGKHLIRTTVTDDKGKYQTLLSKGKYQLLVAKAGYSQEDDISINAEDKVSAVNRKVELKRAKNFHLLNSSADATD
ncbi:MAG: 6-bladed beta-propeller [Candidatus Berkelbacteria bacterium]|nr:6-bladed beta-propeller [Candidatus Berkelbacteria bacterium]